MEKVTCKICGASFDTKRGLVMHVGSMHPDILDMLASREVIPGKVEFKPEPASELAKNIHELVSTTDHLVHSLLLDITKLKNAAEKMKGEK